MSGGRRKFLMRRRPAVVVADVGCGCRRPRPKQILPKLSSFLSGWKLPSGRTPSTAATSLTAGANTLSTTSFSSSASRSSMYYSLSGSPAGCSPKKGRRRRVDEADAGDAVAVEKDSSDPYADFRDSMLQMIAEMELYSWDDLRGLLRRLLALNSPCHHQLILKAFAEILSDLAASPSPAAAAAGHCI